MKKLKFAKMQGTGNDFIVLAGPRFQVPSPKLIQKLCDRIYGVGADGVLLIEKSRKADARMRIFNADGSEAEMCGNGARCAAYYISRTSQVPRRKNDLTLETKAGIIAAEVKGESVKIKLTDPEDLKLDLEVSVGGQRFDVDYVNAGVPHAVIEVEDLSAVDVKEVGRAIRNYSEFKPAGTNVDFVKVIDGSHIAVRTYERGVEDETLACGTGSVASAIIAVLNHGKESLARLGAVHKVFVKTRGGEVLTVYFKASKKKITDVWLEGKVKIVFKGEYHV